MGTMERITIHLPSSLRTRLCEKARRSGRPQSEIVRDAVARYLDAESLFRPSSIGVIDDPGMSGTRIREYRQELARHFERKRAFD